MPFLPISDVARRYSKCVRTIQIWSNDPVMQAKGFPQIIKMRNRQYLPADQLDKFDATMRAQPA
jgi:hypothetical protein